MLEHLKSKLLTYTTEIKLFKTAIMSVLMCGSEIWVLTESVNHRLSILVRKILRKVYGPIQGREKWWR